MKIMLTILLLALGLVPAAMAADAPPEICSTSIMAEGPVLVYGAGFDDDNLFVHFQFRPRPDLAGKAWEDADLLASLARVRAGKAQMPAEPAANDPGWKKVEQKEANILFAGSEKPYWNPAVKLVRVRNAKGVSRPFRMGRPEIWGVSPRSAQAGDTLTIWGANIAQKFALVPAGRGKPEILDAHRPYNDNSDRPAIKFIRRLVLPAGTAPGDYLLYNWSEFGDMGWSEPFKLQVTAPPAGDKAVFNVRDAGAKGDGTADDTKAVLAAMAAAGKVKGKVFFPAGRYIITQPLEVPEGVGLSGVSSDSTIIEAGDRKPFGEGAAISEKIFGRPADFDPATYKGGGWPIDWYRAGVFRKQVYMVWLKSGSSLEGLTVDARRALRVNPVVLIADEKANICRKPAVRNCVVRAKPEALFMTGDKRYSDSLASYGIYVAMATEDMALEHNRIESPDACLSQLPGRNLGARIRYNTFTTLDLHSGYTLWTRRGLQESLVEGNVFENGGRSTTEQAGVFPWPMLHNCYYSNVFRFNRNGDGEQLMEETGGMRWFGQATAGGDSSITAARAGWPAGRQGTAPGAPDFGNIGCTLVIISGRGFGQFRSIVSNTADTITVDRPWDIVPDKTTTFGIMSGGVVETIYVSNEFLFSQFYSGIFGSGLRNIWTSEVMESMGGGTWLQPIRNARLMYFNLIYGNKYHERAGIVMTNQRTVDDTLTKAEQETVMGLPKSVGNEVRGCSFRNRSYSPAKGGIETSMIRSAWTKDAQLCDIPPILCGMDTDMAFLPGREAAVAVWDSLRWGGYPTEKGLDVLKSSTRWTILADNMVISCPVGFMVGKAVEKTMLSSNTFYDCPEPLLDYGRGTVVMDSFVKNPPASSAGVR